MCLSLRVADSGVSLQAATPLVRGEDLVTKEVRLFLVADNRFLREALARILNKQGGIRVIGTIPFHEGAIREIVTADPQVLVLDATPQALFQFGFVREACKEAPAVKVVLTGMDPDEKIFLRAVRDGAMGYVLKNASTAEITAAIRAVAQNDAVCPSSCCSFLFQYVVQQANCTVSQRIHAELGLTRREQQLIHLVGNGLTNKEIATQLTVSEQTVKNHIHHILRKTGAKSRLSVVELCRSEGLIL
jgi:DNA-binding NarL/FixJ family response regulator